MAEPFITTDHLAAYLRIDPDTLLGDLLAEMCIGSACETLRQMCGQEFDAVANDVVTVASAGMSSLILPDMPVWHVKSVSIGGMEVDPSLYTVDLRNGMLWRTGSRNWGGVWIAGRAAYQVTYSHGYATPGATGSGDADTGSGGSDVDDAPAYPADLVMLACTMAARIYDQGLVSQESTGGYQVIYSAGSSLGLTDREMDIVAKYQFGRDVGLDRLAQM